MSNKRNLSFIDTIFNFICHPWSDVGVFLNSLEWEKSIKMAELSSHMKASYLFSQEGAFNTELQTPVLLYDPVDPPSKCTPSTVSSVTYLYLLNYRFGLRFRFWLC